MGESRSEQTLSSKIMTKWVKEKKVKKISRGIYQFVNTKLDDRTERALKLLEIFEKYQKEKEENITNHSNGQ